LIPLPANFELLDTLDGREILKNVLLTSLFWLAAFGLRWVVLRALRARGLAPDQIRRFTASTRSAVVLVLLVGTAALWFDELKVFALSLAAVAAAIVLATKELIMCLSGSFLRTSARSFEIGDRIEVNGVRGDVIDTALFTTTVLEIGPSPVGHQRTGRAVTLPNSIFFSAPLVNESFTEAYVLHTFTIVVAKADWAGAEAALLKAAQEESAPYMDEARKFFERSSFERNVEVPTQEPKILLQIDNPETVKLVCRLPAPARRKGRIEQAVLRRYLSAMTRD
jgi:small-conductance mechanosensitive channel